MSFMNLLNDSCAVYKKSEDIVSGYNSYNNYETVGSLVYASVPCAVQDWEGKWRDEQVPGAVATVKKEVFMPVITIEEDYYVYIDSTYYTVERVKTGAGRDHHLEVVVSKHK